MVCLLGGVPLKSCISNERPKEIKPKEHEPVPAVTGGQASIHLGQTGCQSIVGQTHTADTDLCYG